MTSDSKTGRLPFWRATWVIARRDVTTIMFSKSFLLFLLAPLFAVLIAGGASAILMGSDERLGNPRILVAMEDDDSRSIMRSVETVTQKAGLALPEIVYEGGDVDARARLRDKELNLMVVLSGDLQEPRLTGSRNQVERIKGRLAVVIAEARRGISDADAFPVIRADYVETGQEGVGSTGIDHTRGAFITSKAAQFALYILTSTLAIMVLTNLIEEKGNKIIEILATAIPMEALFLGKLLGMLCVSAVALVVWSTISIVLGSGLTATLEAAGISIEPMVGWLPFLGLFAVYYVMSYLIFGSIYLTTGGMSPTPREAQIYTLPISIIQLLSFMGGAYAASAGGMATWIGIAFPFTSPYVLLGYAAEKGGSLVHVVGIIWQLAVVTFAIRFGAQIFRSRVIDQRPVFRRKRRDARAT